MRKFKNETNTSYYIPRLRITVEPGDEFDAPDDLNIQTAGFVEITAPKTAKYNKKDKKGD
jgi:hypothetical protein